MTTITLNLSSGNPVFNITLGDSAEFTVTTGAQTQPLPHKGSHSVGGSDFLRPQDIGAQSLFDSESVTLTNSTPRLLTASRAKTWNISSYTSGVADVIMPSLGVLDGDIAIIKANSIAGTLRVGVTSGASTIFLASFSSGNRSLRFVYNGAWAIEPVAMHTHASSEVTDFTAAVTEIVNAIRPL
jgi:hypothetical protein